MTGSITTTTASGCATGWSTTGGPPTQRGHDSVMLASRNTDVDDLNQRARTRLTAAGVIGPDQLEVDGRRFAVGDEIITTRNDYRLGVLNGTRATITTIDTSTGAIQRSGRYTATSCCPGGTWQTGTSRTRTP